MIDAIIILFSITLRAVGIGASSIWYDEAYSLALSQLPIMEIARLQALDFNPPFWEFLLSPITPLFGLIGARIFALLLFAACMLVLRQMLLELEVSDGMRGMILISAGIMPGLIWMAQDARPYALLSLLFLSATLFMMKRRWLGAAACMGLMVFTHAAAPFLILGVLAIGIYLWGALSDTPGHFAWTSLLILFCNAAWPYSLMHAGEFWLGPFSLSSLISSWSGALLAWSIPPIFSYTTMIMIGMIVVVAISRTIRGMSKYKVGAHAIFGMMSMIPLGGMLAFSITFHNIIFYRPLIPLVIPLLAWLLLACSWRVDDLMGITSGLLLLVIVPFIGATNFDPSLRGGHIDAGAQYISAHWQAGDQIYYSDGAIALPFDHYLHLFPHQLLAFDGSGAGLGNPIIMDALGLPSKSFIASGRRTWLIWHREDVMLGSQGTDALMRFVHGGVRLMTLTSPQFAVVEIYLVPFDRALR